MEQPVDPLVPGGGPQVPRYVAFLSYSHRDRREAEWLHRALERYRVPKRLVGQQTAKGPVPARLSPVFRDRDELSAADDLGTELRAALARSGHLIVLCSPASARSPYVRAEILHFKRLHGEGRVLALLVDGDPADSFPEPLRFHVGPDGALTTDPAEPIAADMRREGDGRRLALLKLVAGITGLRLDELVRREAQRRARRLTIIAGAAATGMVLTSGLAVYAEFQRRDAVEQRRIAERETAAARAATDYLIGTFELTDPQTENPRTVSLVTILGRSAERARTELRAQPEIEARLVTAVGRAYNNLGLMAEAEVALARALPAIKRAGPDGAAALATLAVTHMKRGNLDRAGDALRSAERLLGPDPGQHLPARVEVAVTSATVAHVEGNAEAALAAYDRALAYLGEQPAPDPRLEARILNGRGSVLIDLGRHGEAEEALMAANRLTVRYLGPRHLQAGRNWYSLALAAYSSGRLDVAGERIDRAIAIVSDLLDQSNPIRANALSLKGSILQESGRLTEADQVLARAVAAYRIAYGGPHHNIGIADYYRAQIARQQNRPQAALALLDDAIFNYRASYGAEHPNIGEAMVARAEIHATLGNRQAVDRECRSGLAMLDRTMGAEASFTVGLRETCNRLRSGA